MTKKTQIKMEEKINMELLKNCMKKLILTNEFEKTVYDKLEGLRSKVKNGLISVNYDYTKIIKGKTYGRLHPTKGVDNYCCTDSSIRAFFAGEYYDYIDLSCCHANELRDLAAHYGIDNTVISDYCNNRNKYIEKYGISKKTINEQCNNEKLYVKEQFAINIFNMIYLKNGIVSRLIEHEYFKPLWEDIKKEELKHTGDKPYNAKGKFIAIACQTFECEITKRAINFLAERGCYPNSYIYDGLLFKKEYVLDLELLNKYLNTEYFGILLKPVFKFEEFEVSDQYAELFGRDMPEDCESMGSGESDGQMDLTDDEVALYIFDEYKGRIIKNKDILYVYYKNQWVENIEDIFKQWFSVCSLNTKGNPKAKPSLVKSQTSKWVHYALQLKCICIEKLESIDVLDNQKDILPFIDGYYSFIENKFIPYSDETIVYFTYKIGRKFPELKKSIYEEVRAIMLEIFDNNVILMTEVFNCIARSLGNNVQDKVGLCLVGERNSAKGLIIKCLTTAFRGVCGCIIANDLVEKKNSMESAERKNGFMKNFCVNLICISEEVKQKQPLDGTVWKSVVSGGDTVAYRTAYGLLTEKHIRALYILTCNKPPSFDLLDARETLLLCNMPCKFYDYVPDDGIDRGFTIKKSDPSIKIKFEKPEYIDNFTLFILSFYCLKKPLYPVLSDMNKEDFEATDDYVDTSDGLHSSITKTYSINPMASSNKIKASEVHRTISMKYSEASAQKIKVYLEKKGVLQRKIQGTFYYSGITKKAEDSAFIDE